MRIEFEAQLYSSVSADAVVAYVFGDKEASIEGPIAELDRTVGGKIKPLADSGELTGKPLEMVL
ncbi:MAG: hypothetical protein WA185_13770, partial [Candidatus Acidiferrales bacterium]